MPIQGTSRTEYEFLDKIGDGAFGQVYRARHKQSCQIVAVKTIKHRTSDHVDDICDYSLREYRTLRLLSHHPNVVQLYKSFIASADELHLVMEYVSGGNLHQYIQHRRHTRIPFDHSEVRRILRQIMQALEHIHEANVFHRDLKPENVLIASSEDGYPVVKLADFGLARPIDSNEPYTEYISTRWYRAPEVLLRSRKYSAPVDLWAAGSMFAELITLSPLFPGRSQIDQIHRICDVLGSPGTKLFTRKSISRPERRSSPGFARKPVHTSPQLPDSENQWLDGVKLAQRMGFVFPNVPPRPLQALIPSASPPMLDLLRKLLYYDPNRRLKASEALHHPFFQEDKRPRLRDGLERDPLKRARTDINAIDLLSIPTMPLELCPDGVEVHAPKSSAGFDLDAVMRCSKHMTTWRTHGTRPGDSLSEPDESDYNQLNGWNWLKVL